MVQRCTRGSKQLNKVYCLEIIIIIFIEYKMSNVKDQDKFTNIRLFPDF